MKVKVIKQFYDKQKDLKLHEVGDEFEADDKRADELKTLGFVKIVTSAKTSKKSDS